MGAFRDSNAYKRQYTFGLLMLVVETLEMTLIRSSVRSSVRDVRSSVFKDILQLGLWEGKKCSKPIFEKNSGFGHFGQLLVKFWPNDRDFCIFLEIRSSEFAHFSHLSYSQW